MTYGVVIVSWNGGSHLTECLSSLLSQTVPPATVVVIDNASDDRSVDIISSFEQPLADVGSVVTLIRETVNTGFTRAANHGLAILLQAGAADFVLLLNQDATLDSGFMLAAARVLDRDERIGVLGARIFMPDGSTVQHAGGFLERPRMLGRHYGHHQPGHHADIQEQREVEFVTAAAMVIRLNALREVGMFDDIFSPGYYEDVDLCDRMRRQSWKVVYAPTLIATHAESMSFAKRDDLRGLAHRNRLFYAMPLLIDSATREAFSRSELAYVRGSPPVEDARALGLAYLSVLLRLSDALRARVPPGDRSVQRTTALIEMFAGLRTAVLEREPPRHLPVPAARTG